MRPYGEITGHCVTRNKWFPRYGCTELGIYFKVSRSERMAIWREYRKKERQRTRLTLMIECKQNLEGN